MKDALTFGSRKKHLSLPLIEVFSTKGVSDIKMVYTLFCTSKKSCENLNFEKLVGQEKQRQIEFKFSQLLPGTSK